MVRSRLDIVREVWHAWACGVDAEGLPFVHDDAILRPATANWRTFRGHAEIRRFSQEIAEAGITTISTPYEWEEHIDAVIVLGRSTVTGRDGVRNDFDMSWVFGFRDDKIDLIQTFLSYDDAIEALDRR